MMTRVSRRLFLPALLFLGLGGCKARLAHPGKAREEQSPYWADVPPSTPANPRPAAPSTPLVDGVRYEGPTSLQGWIAYASRQKEWRYAEGSLRTRSASWIGRDVHLPERSVVEFTLSNPARIRAFFVSLYTQVPLKVTYSPTYHVANYYTLCIFPESLLFHRLNAEGHDQYLGEKAANPYSAARPEVRLKILSDKGAKRFWVFFDGALAGQWEDPEPFAGEGTGIMFQAFASPEELSVSKIRVSAWDAEADAMTAGF